MAHRHMRSERTSPRYLGPREMRSAPPTVTREKRRVWHGFVDFMFGRQKQDRHRRRGSVQRSTTHPQGFILPPYAFQSMGYPPPPPHMGYGMPYGAPHPMAYMPPPPPRAHDLNDRSFMDREFYDTHPENDLRSEYSHQSGSTHPGNHKNYRRDNRNKQQPPHVFSGASPQEIEEYEDEPLPRPHAHRRRSPEQARMTIKDEEDEEDEETLASPIKGFDSFMMY